MIQDIIRKLRRTADLLESMWAVNDPALAPKAARAIEKRIAQNVTAAAAPVKPNGKASADPRLGYKYPAGTHWTQRPENRAKLIKMQKGRNRARLQHKPTPR